jgi:RNA polymerase sigma-70 factor, ECF subfamily
VKTFFPRSDTNPVDRLQLTDPAPLFEAEGVVFTMPMTPEEKPPPVNTTAEAEAPSQANCPSARREVVNVDHALIERAAAGDRTAFEAIVVRYQRRVAAVIRSIVRDPNVTEELSQEVFIRVYLHLADYRGEGHFWGWIQTISRNCASSYLRSIARRDEVPLVEFEDGSHGAKDLIGAVAAAEDEAASRELVDLIDKAFAALPERQRTALALREIDGFDYRAISATMGIPLNTVRSLIFRARESIATAIGPMLTTTRDQRW